MKGRYVLFLNVRGQEGPRVQFHTQHDDEESALKVGVGCLKEHQSGSMDSTEELINEISIVIMDLQGLTPVARVFYSPVREDGRWKAVVTYERMDTKGCLRFTPEAVRSYLDHAIRYWRFQIAHPELHAVEPSSLSNAYVDAFQSMRSSLFGATLPAEE